MERTSMPVEKWDRDAKLIERILGCCLYGPGELEDMTFDRTMEEVVHIKDPSPGLIAALAAKNLIHLEPTFYHAEELSLEALSCLDASVAASVSLLATYHQPIDLAQPWFDRMGAYCPALKVARLIEMIDGREWDGTDIRHLLEYLGFAHIRLARDKAWEVIRDFSDSPAEVEARDFLKRYEDWSDDVDVFCCFVVTEKQKRQAERTMPLALCAWREQDLRKLPARLDALAAVSPTAELAVLTMTLKVAKDPLRRLFALKQIAERDGKFAQLLAWLIREDPDRRVVYEAKALLS